MASKFKKKKKKEEEKIMQRNKVFENQKHGKRQSLINKK